MIYSAKTQKLKSVRTECRVCVGCFLNSFIFNYTAMSSESKLIQGYVSIPALALTNKKSSIFYRIPYQLGGIYTTTDVKLFADVQSDSNS